MAVSDLLPPARRPVNPDPATLTNPAGALTNPLGHIGRLDWVAVPLPNVVVVPAHPRSDGSGLSIELGNDRGTPVAIVFSSVKQLIERLGKHQPWIMLPSTKLPGLLGVSDLEIVKDPIASTCTPVWTEERLQALVEA